MLASKKANASAIIVLTVLLVVTVLLITIFSPTEYRRSLFNESDNGEVEPGDILLFEVVDVSLEETEEDESTQKIYLHDVDLDRAAHKRDLQIASSFSISNSFVKDNFATFSFTEEEGLQNLYITFYVASKEGTGSIKVLLNGNQVDLVSPDEGDRVTVSIPLSSAVEGENQVILRATYPINVFKANSFAIADLRAYLTERSARDEIEHTFVLDKETGFREPNLYAYITEMPYSIENAEITVTLNNKEIFDGVPATVNDYNMPSIFRVPLDSEDLEEGINKILWEVEEGGAYSVDFVKIEYDITETDEDEASFRFNIDDDVYRKVRSTRYDCILTFESDDFNEVFDYSINSEQSSAAISSSKISFNVCDSLEEGLNTLKLYSEEDEELFFDSIKLVIKR